MPHEDLINGYLDGPRILREAVKGMRKEQIDAAPIPGKWSTRGVICHIADFEPVYVERMKRVLVEDEPPLRGGDPDAFAARLCYDHRDIENELQLIEVTRTQMGAILRHITTADFAANRPPLDRRSHDALTVPPACHRAPDAPRPLHRRKATGGRRVRKAARRRWKHTKPKAASKRTDHVTPVAASGTTSAVPDRELTCKPEGFGSRPSSWLLTTNVNVFTPATKPLVIENESNDPYPVTPLTKPVETPLSKIVLPLSLDHSPEICRRVGIETSQVKHQIVVVVASPIRIERTDNVTRWSNPLRRRSIVYPTTGIHRI